jgi:hypothetical protein
MKNSYQLIAEGRKDELWQKHCGFFSLSKDEFMNIQRRLMLEQIKLLGASKIGQALMGDRVPVSVEEFRQITPLTTYADYEPFLKNKREKDLPAKPFVWARTSGRTSTPKWIPYTKAMYDHLSDPVIGAMLMSSCDQPGDVKLERNDKFLMASAPPPYASGYITRSTRENLEVRFLPPLEVAEKMDYLDRVALGFKLAMQEGLDYFMGISIVLARMGEQFERQSGSTQPSRDLLNPFILWRLMRAVVVAKLNNRNILPKDIWKLKGIMSGGTDIEIYKEKIEYYWGKRPLEGFACTEAGNMAMQGWNFKGMVFFPDNAFLEFIPLEERTKNKADPGYQPRTLLYSELQPGVYELVFSNYYGGVLTRYRIGDLFEAISIGDKELGSELPQMKFYSRADDIIDLGGFIRLTERDIWRTIAATNFKYEDWTARKEMVYDAPTLHIYIEPKTQSETSADRLKEILDQLFSKRFPDYHDLKEMLGVDPLKVTLLAKGSFENYMKTKMQAGADLAHLKPPHMQPSDESLKLLQ